jgi:hypothetical protein
MPITPPPMPSLMRLRTTDRVLGCLRSAAELTDIRARRQRIITGEEFYDTAHKRHHTSIGPSLRWLEAIWCAGREAVCQMHRPTKCLDAEAYLLHPGILDGLLNLAGVAVFEHQGEEALQPIHTDKFSYYGHPPVTLYGPISRMWINNNGTCNCSIKQAKYLCKWRVSKR